MLNIRQALEERSKHLSGLDWLLNYPAAELYRLIVDGCLHKKEKGWRDYEFRGEGSLEAAFKGLAQAMTNLEDKTLSMEMIQKIHAAFMTKVKLDKGEIKPGCFRSQRVYFRMDFLNKEKKSDSLVRMINPNGSESGLQEILKAMTSDDEKKMYNQSGIEQGATQLDLYVNGKRESFNYGVLTKDPSIIKRVSESSIDYGEFYAPAHIHIQSKMEDLIQSYNQEIKKAESPDDKLSIIIKTITAFERLHPFRDGNIRTFVIGLLNRLLIQNEFPPATFYNPNIFDGFSHQELIEKVKEAMDVTRDIVLNKKKTIFDFDSADIPPEALEKYRPWAETFRQKIQDIKSGRDALADVSLPDQKVEKVGKKGGMVRSKKFMVKLSPLPEEGPPPEEEDPHKLFGYFKQKKDERAKKPPSSSSEDFLSLMSLSSKKNPPSTTD